MWKLSAVAVILAGLAAPASADAAIGALWTPSVLAKIRDKTTLAPAVEVRTEHLEVFYDSESGDANWGDSGPPYELHSGGTIRIHGYLAAPASGGPYPAVVVLAIPARAGDRAINHRAFPARRVPGARATAAL